MFFFFFFLPQLFWVNENTYESVFLYLELMSDQVVKEVTDAEFSENASEVVLLDEIAFVWEKKRS